MVNFTDYHQEHWILKKYHLSKIKFIVKQQYQF